MTPADPRTPHATAPTAASAGARRRRSAAFFDLDKTIVAKSSAYAFGRQFMESGLLSTSGVVQMAVAQAMYISGGHDRDQMEAAKEQLAAMVTGWRAADVRRIAEESLHEVISPYVYSEAVELVRHHRQAGHDVVVVSASAREIVEPIAAELGIVDVVATELEVVDGVYSGAVPFFCRGGNKARALARLAEERGYDLSRCWAYSDSATDEPMLAAVGHPVAVNPDKPLRRIAEERNWPIRVFRDPVPLFRPPSRRTMGAFGAAAGAAALIAGVAVALRGRRR
ncbi:HAD family hydrolase [Corynebacterium sp. 335C]